MIKSLLIFIISIFLYSCEQEVVSNMSASKGILVQDFYEQLSFLEKTIPSDEDETRTITLTNTGTYPLSDLSLSGIEEPISYVDDSYPGTDGTCSETLEAGESCTINLEIDLGSEINQNMTIGLNYHNGIESKKETVVLGVKILAAGELFASEGVFTNVTTALAASESPVRFPETKLGGRTESFVTLGNSGQRDISIKNISFGDSVYGFTGGSFPGENGTCTTTIKSLEICKVEIFYEPAEEESVNESMVVELNNGITDDEVTLLLNFEATDDRAKISFSIAQIYDLGSFVQTDSKTFTFMLMNARVVAAKDLVITIDNADLNYTGGSFPGTNGDCSLDELGALSFCTLEVEYSANSLGEQTINFTVQYNDNNEFTPLTKSTAIAFNSEVLSGAELALNSSASLNGDGTYGNQELGKTKSHGIAISNIGDFNATVSGFELQGNDDGVFAIGAGGSCGTTITTLEPEKNCTAYITASSDVIGDYTANLVVNYTNGLSTGGESQVSIPLSVSVLSTSNVTASGNSSFGVLPRPSSLTRSRSFTLSNSKEGTANLTFDLDNVSGSDFTIDGNTCGATLAYGAECTIDVTYDPSASGSDYNYIDIYVDDSFKSYKVKISLNGEAKSHANLKITDRNNNTLTDFDYETINVGEAKETVFYLKNSGGYTASSVSASVTGSAFSVSAISCTSMSSMSIAGSGNSGSSCSFRIFFTPDASSSYSETLNFSYYNGEETTNLEFDLTGTGGSIGSLTVVNPIPANYYSLGSGLTDEDFSYTFTLENTGNEDVSSVSLVETSSYLSWGNNGCTGTISPGDQCDVEVTFNTSSAGSYSSLMIYSYESLAETKESSLFVGVSIKTPPDLSLSIQGVGVATAYEFTDAPIGQQSYFRFSISNSGQTAASNISINLSGDSQFSYTALDCDNGESVESNVDCDFYIIYLPDDEVENSASITIDFDNADSLSLALTGNGVFPGTEFNGWNSISAISDSSSGEVVLSWKPMTAVNGAIITGYEVFESSSELPSDIESLAAYKVDTVSETLEANLSWTKASYSLGQTKYFAVRAIYAGGTLETDSENANIKVIIPPANMSLIHPYIANKDQCEILELESSADNSYGCEYTGLGNVDGYLNFNRYLLVDRYEASLDNSDEYQMGPSLEPAEFGNVISASQACVEASETIDSTEYSKSLIRRSEHIVAATWDSSLSTSQVEDLEDGGGDNCYVDASSADLTGAHANCVSKYGVYDLVGNLWEWNSDLVKSKFGGLSSVDAENNEMYSLYLANLLPGEVSDEACFSVIFGLPQASNGGCSNDTMSDPIEDIVGDNYFWPPLVDDSRAIRSGGGIGASTDEQAREAGRYVVDLNQSLSSQISSTGARCVIRLDF